MCRISSSCPALFTALISDETLATCQGRQTGKIVIARPEFRGHHPPVNQGMIEKAYDKFDAANGKDPNKIDIDGKPQAKELFFAKCLSEVVLSLDPGASEALRLASRCQHLCRWEIPRSTQPMGRAGYLKWRTLLKKFHAEKSAEILQQVGYDEETIARVQELNLKKNLQTDPDCQTLEDALCLVFLEHQFDALIADTEEEKMLTIIRKTWAKMSPRGQKAALELDFSAPAQAMLAKALDNQAS